MATVDSGIHRPSPICYHLKASRVVAWAASEGVRCALDGRPSRYLVAVGVLSSSPLVVVVRQYEKKARAVGLRGQAQGRRAVFGLRCCGYGVAGTKERTDPGK